MKHSIPSPEMLRKYLAGKCTDAERQLVNNWYQSLDSGQPEVFAGSDEENLYNRIQVQIEAETHEQDNVVQVAFFWTYAIRIAAVLCIALGFVYYFYFRPDKKVAVAKSATSDWISFENQEKKVSKYILPDSTLVWLNPGAKLSYSRVFAQRQVTFSGEGFFDVTSDKSRPFVIYSGNMKTRVLGTSFNVRANVAESTCKVTVVTGVVEVESLKEKKPVVLRPKQQVIFAKNSNSLTVKTLTESHAEKEIWQTVSLVFDEVPMAEVAERLSKIFHVNIEFKNPEIKKCRLKVDFNNQRLPEILEMIDALLGTTYEIDGDKITLVGEGCH
jgi:transmembrane sensor